MRTDRTTPESQYDICKWGNVYGFVIAISTLGHLVGSFAKGRLTGLATEVRFVYTVREGDGPLEEMPLCLPTGARRSLLTWQGNNPRSLSVEIYPS